MDYIIYILSLFGILCVLPKKGRNIGGIVLDTIISIILFADNIYYTYSSNVLSVLQITNLQYGEEIMSTLPMLLKMHQILYFIDILLLDIFVIYYMMKSYSIKKMSSLLFIPYILWLLLATYLNGYIMLYN